MLQERPLYKKIESELFSKGIDIVHPFLVHWYNSQVKPEHQLSDWETPGLGFLLGNTKNIWQYFIKKIKENPQTLENENPFDDFIENTIELFFKDLGISYKIRYAHLPQPHHIAFQKLAHISGLAYLNKMHLCIHPTYGPWFALRAAVVLPISMPISKPEVKSPCSNYSCKNSCELRFKEAIEKDYYWQNWLKIREACAIGQKYRFSEEQILYHYTKDKDILKKSIL